MLRSRAPSSGQVRSERAPVIARLSVAFLGGVLSFLSPCVLPLVPSYVAAIAAPAGGTHGHAATTKQALTDAAPFVVGFTCVFVLLGAGAGVIAAALPLDAAGLRAVAGFILVVLGLALAGALPWDVGLAAPGLLESARRSRSAVLLGAAFATCAVPCVGPVLGATLVVGGSAKAVAPAATTLLAYSLGLALPFLAAALALARVMRRLRSLRNWFAAGRAVGGAVLVGTGALLFFDRIWWLNLGAHRLHDAIGLSG
jgi:cytochrome c-type biogenesis protein